MEKASVSRRTVELAAADLPGYIAGLPRLLTENLKISVSGVLTDLLIINGFYGSGSISIEGDGGCKFQGGVMTNCSVNITLINLEISGLSEAGNAIVFVDTSRSFVMSNCTITGSGSADSEGAFGVRANGLSHVLISNCGISNCATAVIAALNSVVSIYNRTGGTFENNDIGPYVYYGGIILLSGTTPELLGGATSAKSGGLIVKGDGTLL